jgi:ribosome modulation factor
MSSALIKEIRAIAKKGADAKKRGEPITSCPFRFGSASRTGWLAGWNDAAAPTRVIVRRGPYKKRP